LVKITGIPSDEIDIYWSEAEPILKRATDRGKEFLTVDLYEYISKGKIQLWIAFDEEKIRAVCTTQIVTYPRLKVCAVLYLAGSGYKDWIMFQDYIGAWAKENGCSHLEGYFRKGWLRVLKDWSASWTLARKEL